ncbi:MAG: type IV toxin-antitoxin system AbiEi family antitoxin [Acidimicrobiia bacterium]
MVTSHRSVPRSVAPILEALELEQSVLVTLDQLDDLAAKTGTELSGSAAARLLRERGWLLPLRTTGVWEFAPAARAGAIGAGDPFIELRARLETRPLPVAVAAESAAWIHGLASRSPEPHVIGLSPGERLPKSLDGFRVVRWVPMSPTVDVDGLPIWSVATLLAFMGARPDRYRDWPNVSEWIADATRRISVDALRSELAEQPRSGWARTSYLLFMGGAGRVADDLFVSAPEGRGPFHLGPRSRPSRYERRFEVADHIFPTSWSIKATR